MKTIEQAEFTNMCMIYDEKGNVLVQNRVKSWCGYAFPGGHLERRESIVDSVIREVKEETGLTVSNLQLCGVKQAFSKDGVRYIVFLYKTNCFEGQLISNDEGEHFWMPLDILLENKDKMANNFEYMLEVFTKDNLSEHYHLRSENEAVDLVK